jgi:hypothetical protein
VTARSLRGAAALPALAVVLGCSTKSAAPSPPADGGMDSTVAVCALPPGNYDVSLSTSATSATSGTSATSPAGDTKCVCDAQHGCSVVFEEDATTWADGGFIPPIQSLVAEDLNVVVPLLSGDAAVGVLSSTQECTYLNPSTCMFSSTCSLGYSSAGMGLASTLSFTVAGTSATGTLTVEILVEEGSPLTSCTYDVRIEPSQGD